MNPGVKELLLHGVGGFANPFLRGKIVKTGAYRGNVQNMRQSRMKLLNHLKKVFYENHERKVSRSMYSGSNEM